MIGTLKDPLRLVTLNRLVFTDLDDVILECRKQARVLKKSVRIG